MGRIVFILVLLCVLSNRVSGACPRRCLMDRAGGQAPLPDLFYSKLRRKLLFLVFADVLLQLFPIGIIRFFLEQFLVLDNGFVF